MKIAIISFTRNGASLCSSLRELLSRLGHDVEGYTLKRLSLEFKLEPFDSLGKWTRDMFYLSDALIFIGACGIAVRAIAPYIVSKDKDPGVVVIDELGRYIIPILSGHIGGANEISLELEKIIGGSKAIISTSTDINKRFSVDVFAVKNNLYIGSMEMAKKISGKAIEGEKIGFSCDFPVKGRFPEDLTFGKEKIGISIGLSEEAPYEETLCLIPRIVSLGIGCRKGVSMESIEKLVFRVLTENNISIHSIRNICSIDIKKDEKGIIDFSRKYEIDFITFTPERLLEAKGDFESSSFVKSVTGVDNVCERAAALGSGGEIILSKTKENGVTVALGIMKWGACFEN